MDQDVIQKELDALNELKSFLGSFSGDLSTLLGRYASRSQNWVSVPSKIGKQYELNNFEENWRSIQRVIDNIHEKDLPFINKHIGLIEDRLRN